MTHRAFTPEAESIHTRLLSLDPVSTETCVNAATLIREQAETIERLRAALKPFADYADPSAVFPPTIEITKGSRFARRQLTMGDCYEAARVLEQQLRGGVDRGNAVLKEQAAMREEDPRPAEDIIREQRDEWRR
jgi:hypothetical protein